MQIPTSPMMFTRVFVASLLLLLPACSSNDEMAGGTGGKGAISEVGTETMRKGRGGSGGAAMGLGCHRGPSCLRVGCARGADREYTGFRIASFAGEMN